MNLTQHLSLLLRSERSLILRDILQGAVKAGDHVLDAGCGTGLLAVWAAQAGATRVLGVDAAKVDAARQLARDNGVEARTEFRQGDLRNLDVAEQFRLVLAMIYWNDPRRDEEQSRIAGELCRRYLAAGGEPIPDSVRYTAQGYAWPEQHISQYWQAVTEKCAGLEGTYGLKLGALARSINGEIHPAQFPVRRADGRIEMRGAQPLTDVTPFVTIDYRTGATAYPSQLKLHATSAGRLDAVIWNQQLVYRDTVIFENESISWVNEPVDLRTGDHCALRIDDHWRRTNILTPA